MATFSKTLLYIALLSGCGVSKVFAGLHSSLKNGVNGDGSDGNGNGLGDDPFADLPVSTPGTVTAVRVSPDAPGCGRGQIAEASQTPIVFMFTIDRSGSMNDTRDATAQHRPTKWTALKNAMRAVFDDMGNATGAATAVGVNYFHGDSDTVVEKEIQQMSRTWADDLMNDIAGRDASSYTPTEDALRLSYTSLESYTGLPGANKVNVLVSDGKPRPDPVDDTVIPTLVHDKAQGPQHIRTFSIGIGELTNTEGRYGYEPTFMADIAVQGNAARPGCDPAETMDVSKFCHYQVTPSASANITNDLLAAFSDIRTASRSCRLPITIEDPAHLEPRAVIVVAERADTGQRILANDTWSFDDPTHPTAVLLKGDECVLIQQDPSEHVFVVIGCVCGTPGVNDTPPPGRQSESGGGTGTGPWDSNWCSYPWAATGSTGCLGEGCP